MKQNIVLHLKLFWWDKYTLKIDEASIYFGIGATTLRKFLKEHADEKFLLYTGTKVHIKKRLFEKYIDDEATVI